MYPICTPLPSPPPHSPQNTFPLSYAKYFFPALIDTHSPRNTCRSSSSSSSSVVVAYPSAHSGLLLLLLNSICRCCCPKRKRKRKRKLREFRFNISSRSLNCAKFGWVSKCSYYFVARDSRLPEFAFVVVVVVVVVVVGVKKSSWISSFVVFFFFFS